MHQKKLDYYTFLLQGAKARMMEGLTSFFGKENMTPDGLDCLVPRGIKEVGPDQYVFTRDMKLYVLGSFQHWTQDLLLDFANQITCPHLIVLCDQGLLSRSQEDRKSAVQPILDQFKLNPKFTCQEIESTHHAHLTHPELMANCINAFNQKYLE